MKLTAHTLLIAPLLLLFTTPAIATPNPQPAAGVGQAGVKAKISQLARLPNPGRRDVEDATELLEKRASVTGTVNADGVRYRRCAETSCDAIGQYNTGQVITIQCRVQSELVNGYPWWDKMSNGYYISDFYVDWTGGIPAIC